MFAPDLEIDRAPRHGGEGILKAAQVSCDERKQIGRLGERVVPDRAMAAFAQIGFLDQIAVGEQDRTARPVGIDGDGPHGQDIRAVGIEGDAPESFRLALGAVLARGHVEPFKRGVAGRRNDGFCRQGETFGRLMDCETCLIMGIGIGCQSLPVDGNGFQRQSVTIQMQRASARAVIVVRHHGQFGAHSGCFGLQREMQRECFDPIIRCRVIGKMNHSWFVCAHDGPFFVSCLRQPAPLPGHPRQYPEWAVGWGSGPVQVREADSNLYPILTEIREMRQPKTVI